MVGTKLEKEDLEQVYEAIELARSTGKIKKGTNEVTKIVERDQAKMIAIAGDISPPEIVMHLPALCKEKEVLCIEVGSKEELGAAAGLQVGTSSVVIIDEGDSKPILKRLNDSHNKK